MLPPCKDALILNPRACDYDKGYFTDMIEVRDVGMGTLPCIVQVCPIAS